MQPPTLHTILVHLAKKALIRDVFNNMRHHELGWMYYTAQCVLCKVYFSAQPNKLRPISKFKEYYPFEHIFVSACSSARKEHFFKF